MAQTFQEDELAAIMAVVQRNPDGISAKEIAGQLRPSVPIRTLQGRLKHLVDGGSLTREGNGRAARYRLSAVVAASLMAGGIAISPEGRAIQEYLQQAPQMRRPSGYSRAFLDAYRPNESYYINAGERAELATIGNRQDPAEIAGTYAKQVLHRLLIDLSWNSSRLEGNTYSLLDTTRLIDLGERAEGHDLVEAQMIVNHKEAIEFLVSSAGQIGFNRYTLLNLHGILANNLLRDEHAAGRLRTIPVGIEGSAFHPLEVPQLIEECFAQILATAEAIRDPFEQAFFIMVQLPYLQPFDDVNKRVSRLAANIPFIRKNLAPLSFTDVPRDQYTQAILGIYELNDVRLLKDVFLWAYRRSAQKYVAVRQSLGDPDPFRLRHSVALRQVVSDVVRQAMDRRAAVAFIMQWTENSIAAEERGRFREMAETSLLSLHEGNFARYQIRPSEFDAWRRAWEVRPWE